VIAVVEVSVLTAELEEGELVLPVTDFIAERNPISLAEISGLKVSVKVRDVAFDFWFSHNLLDTV
tara:strand:- start:6441 stop:6635 length:195 start_codon:yes stop_codon:yes gene_type:complete